MIQSPDYDGAADRYDLEFAGGADRIVLAVEPVRNQEAVAERGG